MSPAIGGCGPISWTMDRVGVPHPGACFAMWLEFVRLGYLRLLLRERPATTTADLAALLAGAPALLMADSASRGADLSSPRTRPRPLR